VDRVPDLRWGSPSRLDLQGTSCCPARICAYSGGSQQRRDRTVQRRLLLLLRSTPPGRMLKPWRRQGVLQVGVRPASTSGLGWIDDWPVQGRRILPNRRIRPRHSGCRAAAHEGPGQTSPGRPGRSPGDPMHPVHTASRRLRDGWDTWAPAVYLDHLDLSATATVLAASRTWIPACLKVNRPRIPSGCEPAAPAESQTERQRPH
jgi:hypothetical protein